MRKTVWGEVNRGLSGEIPIRQAINNAADVFTEEIENQIYQCYECKSGVAERHCEKCLIDEEKMKG